LNLPSQPPQRFRRQRNGRADLAIERRGQVGLGFAQAQFAFGDRKQYVAQKPALPLGRFLRIGKQTGVFFFGPLAPLNLALRLVEQMRVVQGHGGLRRKPHNRALDARGKHAGPLMSEKQARPALARSAKSRGPLNN
jgi:hypothetical protein